MSSDWPVATVVDPAPIGPRRRLDEIETLAARARLAVLSGGDVRSTNLRRAS